MPNGVIPPPPPGFTLDPPPAAGSDSFGLRPALRASMIAHESSGNPNAVSPKGAIGLMQVMPATAAQYGVSPQQLRDPRINVDTGSRYYGDLLKHYNGNEFLALVAYHSGPHRVDKGILLPESVRFAQSELGGRQHSQNPSMLSRIGSAIGGGLEGTAQAADIPPPPPGYTLDESHPPPGFTLDKPSSYDPAQAEQVEPGVTQGLQPSMIQPADLLTFGLAGGAEAAGEAALEAGTGLLGREALSAGLKTGAAAVPLGLGISAASQAGLSPLTSAIPTDTPFGVLARGTAEQAAGMLPFLTGGALPETATSAWGRVRGETPVAKEAMGVAEKQTAANIAEQEKLSKAAGTERLGEERAATKAETKTREAGLKAQRLAGEKAAQQVREANLASRAGAYEAVAGTEAEPSAQARLAETRTAADEHLAKQTADLQRSSAQAVLPEAKAAALGAPPLPATMEAGPDRQARDMEFRAATHGPLTAFRQDWGQQRDALLAEHMDETPDPSKVREPAATELAKWVPSGHRPYGAAAASLLDEAAHLGEAKVVDDFHLLKASGYDDADIERLYSQPSHRIVDATLERLREDYVASNTKPPKVSDLLTLQAKAKRLAMTAQGADQTAAKIVSRSVDDALADFVPTNELKALNAKYRDHRAHFPYQFEDKIEKASRPLEVASDLFNHPERTLDLARLGGARTRQALLQLYGQWMGPEGGGEPKPAHAAFLKELVPNTPYADPRGWVYEKKAEDHLSQVIDSSPQVRQRWEALVNKGKQEYFHDYSQKIAGFAFKDAPRFGPAGQRLITAMRAAPTPEAQANLVNQFYSKLTPEQAVLEQATGQPSPIPAAEGAAMVTRAGQKTPRQAVLEARQAAPTTARAAERAFMPPDPSEAAIEAIQQRGYKPTALRQTAGHRMAWTIPGGLGGLLAYGHPSGYAIGSVAMDVGIGLRERLVRSFQESLRDPIAARRFYQAITNPGTPRNFEFLAGEAAKAGIASAAERAGYDMSIPQPHSEEGPGVKQLNQSRAEALAPTPSASKRAVKVTKQLAKGKQPEVHRDLDRGRLSLDETNKLIQFASADDPSSIVQGMPLEEVLNAAEVAGPDERKMLMPMIMQRLRAELPKMQNKTQQANLANRFKRLQTLPAQAEA